MSKVFGGFAPVCKIKVELSVERHPEGGGDKDAQVVGARGGVIVRHKGDPVRRLLTLHLFFNSSYFVLPFCCTAIYINGLPNSKLDNTYGCRKVRCI